MLRCKGNGREEEKEFVHVKVEKLCSSPEKESNLSILSCSSFNTDTMHTSATYALYMAGNVRGVCLPFPWSLPSSLLPVNLPQAHHARGQTTRCRDIH